MPVYYGVICLSFSNLPNHSVRKGIVIMIYGRISSFNKYLFFLPYSDQTLEGKKKKQNKTVNKTENTQMKTLSLRK